MSKLTVEVASGAKVFEVLRDAWQQLQLESECSPFVSWEWMSTWYRSFGEGVEPMVLRALDGDCLLGILPLRAGAVREAITFLGNELSGADHLDLIARTADRERVAAACAEFLTVNGRDAIVLDELSPRSPLRAALRRAATSGGTYFERDSYVCPHVDLAAGWHRVLAGSRRASNFKRRLKQLEEIAGFQFRSVSLPADVPDAFERFLVLHDQRWGSGVSDLSGRRGLAEFHRDVVAQMAASGSVRFDELWIRGECVASIYGFDDGRTFYYFNAGYDPEYSRYSVGLVLLGLSIRAACDRGRSMYDFLRGDEAYKWDWANGSETLVKACLVSNTFAGRAFAIREGLAHHVRGISRAVLPAAARERLRAWRHGDVRPAAHASA